MISIIIPAHNEAAVIARTLKAMTRDAAPGEQELIVVCNGCTDDTATVARCFEPTARVVETELSGKAHALNLGDGVAVGFPRIYADADVILDTDAIRMLALRLEVGDVLAVAPTAKYDLSSCSWPVRAFYDVRSRLPSAQEGIGGSGVYALSEAGRCRFLEFPSVIADDGYVRIQFKPEERETLSSASSDVFPPRTTRDLIAIKTRAHYGSFELERLFPDNWRNRGASNNRSLLRLFRKLWMWPKLAVYCLITIIARRRAWKRFGGEMTWERDDTSRVATQ